MTQEARLTLAAAQLFAGPGIAAWHACCRAVLVHAGVPAQPTDALRARLAAFAQAHDGARSFAPQLHSGDPAQAFAAIAQGLQHAYRHNVHWQRITAIDADSSEIVLEIMHPECSQPLLALALALTQAAFGLPEAPAWSDPGWNGLRDLWPRPSHFNSQDRILTARQMGLHCETGAGIHRAQYIVGQGRWHRLTANAYTAHTSHLGKDLSGNKIRARTALARAGLPVPAQRSVESAREAVREAERMGYPVVLKPSGSRRSQGVYTMLADAGAIERVFPLIADDYGGLILEKQILGQDYRLLVVGTRCIAVARRLHPAVTGDGLRTIAELAAASNTELARDGIFNDPVEMDPETLQALRDQGFEPGSIPAQGQAVVLRKAACLASLAEDVTHAAHPSLLRLAEQAAAAVQLDLAGIDLVCPDITQPWQGTETAIVEINAGPAVDINAFPDIGTPQPVARALWRTAIPAGQHGNIPVVALVGRYHKQQGAQHVCQTLRMAGLEAYVPGTLDAPFPADLPAYQSLARAWTGAWLARDEVEALVLPLSWTTLAQEGLPVAQHSVAIFTDDDGAFAALGRELAAPQLRERLYRLVADACLCGAVYPAASAPLHAALAHLPPHARMPLAQAEQPGTLPGALATALTLGGEAIAWINAPQQPGGLYWIDTARQWHALVEWPPQPGTPPPAAELPMLAASLGALRLLGYDLATLRRLAALHTGQSALLPPAGAPWRLHAPGTPTQAVRQWLPTLATQWQGAGEVHCSDSVPMRSHLGAWLGMLPAAPLRWCIAAPGTPAAEDLPAQLAAHGVPPALVCTAPAPPLAPGPWPSLHLDDLREAPVLHGWAAQEAPAADGLLWRPSELPRIANAAWVGGAPAAHRACTGLALAPGAFGPGVLAIVPGHADSHEATAAIAQRTREAFAQGAWAVMSAVMPAELPRWHALLLSDDPEASVFALARAVRQRYAGRLTAQLAAPDDAPREAPEPLLRAALALAALPRDAAAANIPLAWSLEALLLARPHAIVLPRAAPALAQHLQPWLPFLGGADLQVSSEAAP